jgi:hypothetical protein
MKEEAIKIADDLEVACLAMSTEEHWATTYKDASAMIRRLVEELDRQDKVIQAYQIRPRGKSWALDKQTKPLSDFEIFQISECYPDRLHFARAIEAKVRGDK